MADALVQLGFEQLAPYYGLLVLAVYDFVLTFQQEIEFMWHGQRKLSLGFILFLVIRYSGLLYAIFIFFTFSATTKTSNLSCVVLQWFSIILTVVMSSAVGILSAFRVYALYEAKRSLMVSILLISQTVPVLQLAVGSMGPQRSVVVGAYYTCEVVPSRTLRIFELMFVGMRVACIVVDLIVLSLTCIKLVPQLGVSRPILPIGKVIVTDGVIYFAALLGLHIFGLMLSEQSQTLTLLISWNTVTTAILASRCMLDLREAAAKAGLGEWTAFSLRTVREDVNAIASSNGVNVT